MPGEGVRHSIRCALRSSDCGLGNRCGIPLRRSEGHVDIFEDGAASNVAEAVAGLDEVVAGLAGLFAAERVGKDERLSELTGVHEETRAVDGPLTSNIHNASPLGGGLMQVASCLFRSYGYGANRGAKCVCGRTGPPLGWCVAQSEVTVRAERERVNYTRIVQRWNFFPRVGCDESGSSTG